MTRIAVHVFDWLNRDTSQVRGAWLVPALIAVLLVVVGAV